VLPRMCKTAAVVDPRKGFSCGPCRVGARAQRRVRITPREWLSSDLGVRVSACVAKIE
jgi:hypothetical protein